MAFNALTLFVPNNNTSLAYGKALDFRSGSAQLIGIGQTASAPCLCTIAVAILPPAMSVSTTLRTILHPCFSVYFRWSWS